jgi:hypothetical protein
MKQLVENGERKRARFMRLRRHRDQPADDPRQLRLFD